MTIVCNGESQKGSFRREKNKAVIVNLFTNTSAVFDCNVLLQATARNNSPASACLRLAESGAIKLFVSEETLFELEEILNRDFIKDRFGFAANDIEEVP